jgi:hypothetical protein
VLFLTTLTGSTAHSEQDSIGTRLIHVNQFQSKLRTVERAGDSTVGGGQLRVLLVICRPGGRDDVPFRSEAFLLVRGGAGKVQTTRAPGPTRWAICWELAR